MAMTRREILRRYYEKNKAEIRRRQKIYEDNPEVLARHNKSQKSYYERVKPEPKEKISMTDLEKKLSRQRTSRKYNEKNKEKIAADKAKWRLNNPGLYALYCAKRRSKKLGNGIFAITTNDIKRMYHRQDGECFWCKEKLNSYEMDHVIPISRGGRHSIGNLVLSCTSCNGSKSDKLPVEFRMFRDNVTTCKSNNY